MSALTLHSFYCSFAGEKKYIALGVCDDSYPSHSLPGWDTISVGLHMDNGTLFQSCGEAIKTNQVFREGDIIKCSVRDFPADAAQPGSVEIQFSCNSMQIISVVVENPLGGFYGVIGMMSKGEAITLSPPVASKMRRFLEMWEISTPALVKSEEDGMCSYVGPGDLSEHSIGSARQTKPIDPLGDLSQRSFSLRIVNCGEKGFIGMGIVNKTYSIDLLPGWKESSIGYHADSGEILQGNNSETPPTSSPCSMREGDVMQCIVKDIDNSQKQIQVTFLRNGVKVTDVTAWNPSTGFYFCFGMMSKGEVVQVLLPEMSHPFTLPKLDFEAVWAIMNTNIEHHGSGICYYIGGEKVGTVRSKKPLNPFSSTNFFEVKIVEPGKKCYIALGACSQLYSIDDLPGWEDLSVGYHADEGCILQKTAGQEKASDPCGKGDIIRCTVEPVDGSDKQMNVIYHKNGSFIGKSILWKPGDGQVFAQIGCMSEGEVIQISSPWQSNSQLKADSPSASYSSKVRTTRPSRGRLADDSHDRQSYEGVSPSDDHAVHSGNKSMEHFLQDMYHQIHGIPYPSGMPSPELPFAGAMPTMHIPFHSASQPHFQGYGHYPWNLSSSVPPRPGRHLGNPQNFLSQKSDPIGKVAHPNYFQMSSSSSSASTSEVPNPYSTQFSASSISSLESVPEGACMGSGRGLEDSSHDVGQHQPLHLHPAEQPLQVSTDGSSSYLGPLAVGELYPPASIDGEVIALSRTPEETSLHPGGLLATACDVDSLLSTETVRPSHESITLLRSPSIAVEPVVLRKAENKMFKILHNVQVDAEGSLEYATLHPDSPDNSFIMFRLPLNEKCNYFEVEILRIDCNSNIAVGIVWDHYPVYRLPGILDGSIAYHTNGGTILYGRKAQSTDTSCIVGDVIGCRVALKYKSEIISHSDEGLVEIKFFRNGIWLCTQEVFLPPNGFYPAIGMTGHITKVRACCSILRTPEKYFENHPLPDGYMNFPTPSVEFKSWQCLQRSKVDGIHLYGEGDCCGKPTVIQSNLPFTHSSDYFHVQLQSDITLYSVLSIGVACKLSSGAIPGEAPNSVSYLPLLGLFMSNGVICWTVPESVNSNLCGKCVMIGVGIQYSNVARCSTPISASATRRPSQGTERTKLFFTVNGQQIHDIITEVPEGGFYPTLAIERDCTVYSESLAIVEFPKQFPFRISGLPLGFIRGMSESMLQVDSCSVKDKLQGDFKTSRPKSDPVRVMQAAQPLSPTRPYFDVRILHGGGTYKISCGLANYIYPMNVHPGLVSSSIALHADDCNLYINGEHTNVSIPSNYIGALLGCGIRFPDNSNTSAEVFFTLNKKMVASKLVKVPHLGLYPTVGMQTNGGSIEVNIHAQDPYPSLKFKTGIEFVENMEVDGSIVQLISSSNPGAIQMSRCPSRQEQNFMEVTCLTERTGRIMVGFCTSKSCPINFVKSRAFSAGVLDIVSGKLMIFDQYYKVRGSCPILNSQVFGIGLEPVPDSNQLLLFITSNGYIVSYCEVDIQDADVYPCVLMVDSTTRLEVDLCSSWPKPSPIGRGWATCVNLKLVDMKITHSSTQIKKRLPVGYAQAGLPLTSSRCYFEVEICSRAVDKAIAIGLASRTHLTTQWIGWSQNSIGYHTDDGKLFKESSTGQSFGPKVYSGDTIGCGARLNRVCVSEAINCNTKMKVEVFFTINGALLNTQKMTIPPGGFFPTLCLESPSESVIFHQYTSFPPVASLVDSIDWASAYSVKQVGITISNSCRHKEINGGLPKAFSQARLPFSNDKPYFQVEIASHHRGNILVGASVKIPVGCTTPNTHSLFYSNNGQIITRRSSEKSSRKSVKCYVGDIIGYSISFSNGMPSQAHIYINHSKVHTSDLTGLWNPQDLYPTIILAQPGDSVIPTLQMKFPSWNRPPLIGWLRSERVQVHNNTIEYTAQAKNLSDIGVAQISQPFQLDTLPYYEVEIIESGNDCRVGVGAACAEYPLNMQPGWCKDSVAYHGDDGRLFHQADFGIPFASTWKQRDVIGLGIRPASGLNLVQNSVQVYFTKNGIELGHMTASIPPGGFFPIIGMHSVGVKVKISLGLPCTLPCNTSSLRSQWHALFGIHVEKSPNGHLLAYRKGGRISTSNLISFAMYAQAFSITMQYFEIELHSMGSVGIAMGVAPHEYPLDQNLGWNVGSIAYHTINGRLYNASLKGKEFGPVAHCGSIIGCGVTFLPNNTKYCSVFFTYNGIEIGRVRTTYPSSGLYPAVALTDDQDKVSVKFYEAFKPRLSCSEVRFVNLMRINNCSYSEQIVSFKGSGDSGFSSAPAMAQFAVALRRDHSYYATNIVECKDNILIGLAVKDYPIQYAPGTTSISLAYDILKGYIRTVYNSEDFFADHAPVCVQGDNVGCGIHFSDDVKTESAYVYFTHNNLLVHKINISDEFLLEDFYPIVGFVPQNKSSSIFMDWNSDSFVECNVF